MNLWIRQRGKVLGPLPLEKVLIAFNAGKFAVNAEMSDDQATWRPISDLARLGKTSTPPPEPPVAPVTSAPPPISAPPPTSTPPTYPTQTQLGYQQPMMAQPMMAQPMMAQPMMAQPSRPQLGNYCRSCGTPVAPQTALCMRCGSDPKVGQAFCPTCGSQTNPAQVICMQCGTALTQETSTQSGGNASKKSAAEIMGIVGGVVGFVVSALIGFVVSLIGLIMAYNNNDQKGVTACWCGIVLSIISWIIVIIYWDTWWGIPWL